MTRSTGKNDKLFQVATCSRQCKKNHLVAGNTFFFGLGFL